MKAIRKSTGEHVNIYAIAFDRLLVCTHRDERYDECDDWESIDRFDMPTSIYKIIYEAKKK